MATPTSNDPKSLQGEGNYDAARKFDKEEAAFAKSGKVEAGAKAAKDALEGPEAEALEAARLSTGKGDIHKKL